MFLKTLRFVPMLSVEFQEHTSRPFVIHAFESLMGLPILKDGEIKHAKFLGITECRKNVLITKGGFIADQTGLGQTIMMLFFLA